MLQIHFILPLINLFARLIFFLEMSSKTCPVCHGVFSNVHQHLSRTINSGCGRIYRQSVANQNTAKRPAGRRYSPRKAVKHNWHVQPSSISYSTSITSTNATTEHTNMIGPVVPVNVEVDSNTTFTNDDSLSMPNNDSQQSVLSVGLEDNEAEETSARPELSDMLSPIKYVSPSDQSMARLYQLCNKAGAPRYLCDDIIQQIQKEVKYNHFDLMSSQITSRKAFLHRLQKQNALQDAEAINVTLESGQDVVIHRFNYIQDLQQHLVSNVYADCTNVVTGGNDVWGYHSSSDQLSELPHGQWYQRTLSDFETKHGIDASQYQFLPLIGYNDGTILSKMHIEPVVIVPGNLTQSAREDISNWIMLGFVPNLHAQSGYVKGGSKKKSGGRSMHIRNYHHCLHILLQPLKELQAKQSKMWFRRGDDYRMYCVYAPIACWIGDNKAADELCGKIANRSRTSVRMSRRCLTCFNASDASHHECHPLHSQWTRYLISAGLGCTYGFYGNLDESDDRILNRWKHQGSSFANFGKEDPIKIPTIDLSPNIDHWVQFLSKLPTKQLRQKYIRARKKREELCDEILQKILGSHLSLNPFDELDFGRNEQGITRATVADLMHTLEEGIMWNFLEVFFAKLTPTISRQMDEYVESLFGSGNNRSSERFSAYPRVSFRHGFCNLSNLTADERVGKLFTLSVLFQTSYGRSLIQKRYEYEDKHVDDTYASSSGEMSLGASSISSNSVQESASELEKTNVPPISADGHDFDMVFNGYEKPTNNSDFVNVPPWSINEVLT